MIYLYDKNNNESKYSSSTIPFIIEYGVSAYMDCNGKFVLNKLSEHKYIYCSLGFYVACPDKMYVEDWIDRYEHYDPFIGGSVVSMNTNGVFDNLVETEMPFWYRGVIETHENQDYHLYTIDPTNNNKYE